MLICFHLRHSFLKRHSLSSTMHYANLNSRVLFPFVSFSCSSTRYNDNMYRVYRNAYTYYTEITLNWFTGIISISLSSNYTFPSNAVWCNYTSHTCCIDTRYSYQLPFARPTTTYACVCKRSSFVKFAINRNMINVGVCPCCFVKIVTLLPQL